MAIACRTLKESRVKGAAAPYRGSGVSPQIFFALRDALVLAELNPQQAAARLAYQDAKSEGEGAAARYLEGVAQLLFFLADPDANQTFFLREPKSA